jgi:hypothetical protein
LTPTKIESLAIAMLGSAGPTSLKYDLEPKLFVFFVLLKPVGGLLFGVNKSQSLTFEIQQQSQPMIFLLNVDECC